MVNLIVDAHGIQHLRGKGVEQVVWSHLQLYNDFKNSLTTGHLYKNWKKREIYCNFMKSCLCMYLWIYWCMPVLIHMRRPNKTSCSHLHHLPPNGLEIVASLMWDKVKRGAEKTHQRWDCIVKRSINPPRRHSTWSICAPNNRNRKYTGTVSDEEIRKLFFYNLRFPLSFHNN